MKETGIRQDSGSETAAAETTPDASSGDARSQAGQAAASEGSSEAAVDSAVTEGSSEDAVNSAVPEGSSEATVNSAVPEGTTGSVVDSAVPEGREEHPGNPPGTGTGADRFRTRHPYRHSMGLRLHMVHLAVGGTLSFRKQRNLHRHCHGIRHWPTLRLTYFHPPTA